MNNQNIFKGEDDPLTNAPGLTAAGKVNPFLVPDGYFEELPSLIHQRCQPVIRDQRIHRGIFIVYRKPLLAAATVLAFVITIYFLAYHHRQSYQVTREDVASYVLEEAQSGNFLNTLDDADIYSLSPDESNVAAVIPGDYACSTDEIIDYLVDENIDLTTINQPLNIIK